MENGWSSARWGFKANKVLKKASPITVRGVVEDIMSNIDQADPRTIITFGSGDPSASPFLRTTTVAQDAVADALQSGQFNGYAPTTGLLPTRRAVAYYLSKDLPSKLSPDDIFLTVGCGQAIEIMMTILATPGANILLPRPGFYLYEARAAYSHLEIRFFDLIPEKAWEVDLDVVEDLADENTVAIVVINPGNPCGNVYTYKHLNEIAVTAKKLGILVIADEVYGHLTFDSNPFVPMGVFGSIVPIITLGSISKRWLVPGWRLGWLVINDTKGVLKKHGIVDCIEGFLNITPDPATFMQGAIPQMIKNTKDDFFSKTIEVLKETADVCYNKIKEIPCITCPSKPEGSMFVLVKLNLSLMEDVKNDLDFCVKLAKEESVVVVPGVVVGMKDWLRITFAVDPSSLVEGLERIKAFSIRHSKKLSFILSVRSTMTPGEGGLQNKSSCL